MKLVQIFLLCRANNSYIIHYIIFGGLCRPFKVESLVFTKIFNIADKYSLLSLPDAAERIPKRDQRCKKNTAWSIFPNQLLVAAYVPVTGRNKLNPKFSIRTHTPLPNIQYEAIYIENTYIHIHGDFNPFQRKQTKKAIITEHFRQTYTVIALY